MVPSSWPCSTPWGRWWRCSWWCTTWRTCRQTLRLSSVRELSTCLQTKLTPTQTFRSGSATWFTSGNDRERERSRILIRRSKWALFVYVVTWPCGWRWEEYSYQWNSQSLDGEYYSLPMCFRVTSSKSGKIYLHTDVRMIIFRKSDLDTATEHESGKGWELRWVLWADQTQIIYWSLFSSGLSLADPQIQSFLQENEKEWAPENRHWYKESRTIFLRLSVFFSDLFLVVFQIKPWVRETFHWKGEGVIPVNWEISEERF